MNIKGLLLGGKVAGVRAHLRKSFAVGCRNAHASKTTKRGAAAFVVVHVRASLGQPPLGKELCETGLGEDDEPNKRGHEIESLIDWVGARIRWEESKASQQEISR